MKAWKSVDNFFTELESSLSWVLIGSGIGARLWILSWPWRGGGGAGWSGSDIVLLSGGSFCFGIGGFVFCNNKMFQCFYLFLFIRSYTLTQNKYYKTSSYFTIKLLKLDHCNWNFEFAIFLDLIFLQIFDNKMHYKYYLWSFG